MKILSSNKFILLLLSIVANVTAMPDFNIKKINVEVIKNKLTISPENKVWLKGKLVDQIDSNSFTTLFKDVLVDGISALNDVYGFDIDLLNSEDLNTTIVADWCKELLEKYQFNGIDNIQFKATYNGQYPHPLNYIVNRGNKVFLFNYQNYLELSNAIASNNQFALNVYEFLLLRGMSYSVSCANYKKAFVKFATPLIVHSYSMYKFLPGYCKVGWEYSSKQWKEKGFKAKMKYGWNNPVNFSGNNYNALKTLGLIKFGSLVSQQMVALYCRNLEANADKFAIEKLNDNEKIKDVVKYLGFRDSEFKGVVSKNNILSLFKCPDTSPEVSFAHLVIKNIYRATNNGETFAQWLDLNQVMLKALQLSIMPKNAVLADRIKLCKEALPIK